MYLAHFCGLGTELDALQILPNLIFATALQVCHDCYPFHRNYGTKCGQVTGFKETLLNSHSQQARGRTDL